MTSQQNGDCGGCWPEDVGIHALEVYFPHTYVDQEELEIFDKVSKGKYTVGLGQNKMGFCNDREDIHSLALTVVSRLLERTGVKTSQIGRLEVGTETLVDKSKSVKTVLMQLFGDNTDVEGIDTTNACYGGTQALLNSIAWVESSEWDGRWALAVAADIAIYATGPARPTGGAGAIAMLVKPKAPLVLERGVRASHMAHVYDFYKPDMLSEYPTVDGKLSVECYSRALDKCYQGYCQKFAKLHKGAQIRLKDFDALIFHSPYGKLVQKSLARLVLNDFLQHPNCQEYQSVIGFKDVKLEDTIFDRDVEKAFIALSNDIFVKKTKPSLLISNQVGNTYTSALYSCLASYLGNTAIESIAGRRLGMFSYGSGSAATFFSLRVTDDVSKGSPLQMLHESLADLKDRLAQRIKVSPLDFGTIMKHRQETHHLAPHTPVGSLEGLSAGTWYLTQVDDMHRRTYSRKPLKNQQSLSNGSAIKEACFKDVAGIASQCAETLRT
ncbi:hydroxymethylglutaryl-CoA synthase 1 [Galendromus occidentalis]|uniref:Hydroxymethylglutaryl-CoA synthase n=1 Tax=Galendromus occidentalis TaxID=34638 RepID=A0AAJ6QXM7_9ACAR|nr:hydroxymethylglutaryl-CoA synthase 1 [Galendromus occidentalis]